ncbi:MAG: tRNA modification GTPase [Gammaproteobacteria bacterium]
MTFNDPIAAIATPVGRGAVGIVRISGHKLDALAHKLIGSLPPNRIATLRSIRAGDAQTIDRALVIYFSAPKSFTGEDVLEIQTHGGVVQTRDVLKAAIDAGARMAVAGEFTERAYLNGKIDLIQAEAIADLIESSSTRAARLALSSLVGEFSKTVVSLAQKLKLVRVQLEAYIDFPDEDISPVALRSLVGATTEVHDELRILLANANRGARLNSGVDVVIIGRPNVGKSTLLNALADEQRAIVTNVPGTTRDVLSVDLSIEGLSIRVHDTAGIRDSSDLIEQEGVRRAKQKIEQSDLVLYVTDADADELIEFISTIKIPVFTVRNKIDVDGLEPVSEKTTAGVSVRLSAKHLDGLGLLRREILDHFNLADDSDSAVLARERHLIALKIALDALTFNVNELFQNEPELGAEQLRLAGRALGELTGEYTNDELLGDIFSTFCVGK